MITSLLKEEQNKLQNLCSCLDEKLRNAPKGRLRITHCRGRTVYKYREELPDTEKTDGQLCKKERSIRKTEQDLLTSLAQRDYDRLVLKAAGEELELLNQFLVKYKEVPLDQIALSLHKTDCFDR